MPLSLCMIQGELVAVEPQSVRFSTMTKIADRHGFDCIEFHQKTLQDFAVHHSENRESLFDRVLLDVPCSGTGVMAKRADLRWKRRPEDLMDLIHLQVTPPTVLFCYRTLLAGRTVEHCCHTSETWRSSGLQYVQCGAR